MSGFVTPSGGGMSPTDAGVIQAIPTTIDLNQAAGPYVIYTGTAQPFVLFSLSLRPRIAVGGLLTNIFIQTDDLTPQLLITPVQGAVANLTANNNIIWTGQCYIAVARLIQLIIVGGPAGVVTICDIVASGYAAVNDGTLTP